MTELKNANHWQDLAIPSFAIVCVVLLLFRLPTSVMDVALAVNLALSAVVFLTVFFVRKPLEFSTFPTVLLITTLLRLALNVSTTRLILTQHDAGRVIDAFSRFVAGDNLVVGAVVFLIFIIIQFVVITKGATRISEVSARFTLDALPGRQSAIDYDLNAGRLSEAQASRARAELARQTDFFGAMDGASKFVRGDAVAGLLIVAVNIIGGLAIGILQEHISVTDALTLYAKLTIGDGLASQVPAFLISLATGMLVSRASSSENLSQTALRQTFGRPVVLTLVGVFLILLAFTGLPLAPLLTIAAGCLLLAWRMSKRVDFWESDQEESGADANGNNFNADQEDADRAQLEESLAVDPLRIELGSGLLALAQPEGEPSLLQRVKNVRMTVASELGLVLPKARVCDNPKLDDGQLALIINGDVVAYQTIYPNMLLAYDCGDAVSSPHGLQTDILQGQSAYWIEGAEAENAQRLGYSVVSPGEAIEMRLVALAREHADDLLSRDGAKRLVERLRVASPALVEETLGSAEEQGFATRLAAIQRVLQLLLREGVSIRPLETILEALGDLALRQSDATVYDALSFVRVRLARAISAQMRDDDSVLHAVMLDPEGEDALRAALIPGSNQQAPEFDLNDAQRQTLEDAVRMALQEASLEGFAPTILVDAQIRIAMYEFMRQVQPSVSVMAFPEVDQTTSVTQASVIEWLG
ncbi:MAG: flagellar biosynthesis protein FlhA [Planctomycetia bacterium]|nr:flagellar biosynthesis protein FlhA [Planctomycetia bacterium]